MLIFAFSLNLAKDKLFPSGATNVLNSISAAWKRSTIFGPLFVFAAPIFLDCLLTRVT
jgi:hypothetical protein